MQPLLQFTNQLIKTMCVDNFIGLSSKCQVTPPTSNLYIDMLEGMNVKNIASFTTGNAINAQALLNEKLKLVFLDLKNNFSRVLYDNVVGHSVDSLICPDFDDKTIEGNVQRRGIEVERKRGQLTKLFIERIYVKSATSVNGVVVTVTDGVNQETYNIDLTADLETLIELNYSTTGKKITIYFENADVVPYVGSVKPYDDFCEYDCNGCGCEGLRVRAVAGNSYLTSFRGIRVDASLQCDTEKMTCLIAQRMSLTVLYMLGIQLLNEWESSDRLNFLTVNNKEWAAAKKNEWQQKVNEDIYQNSQGIQEYLRRAESKCFICNNVKYGYNTP